MPLLPVADPAPDDGALPAAALAAFHDPGSPRPFGIYLHVPFCSVRCGYCDFNTYTPGELGGAGEIDRYAAAAREEVALAARVLGEVPPVRSVFVGGGTPTFLAPAQLTGLLGTIRDTFPLAVDAELTVEANPDTVTPGLVATLAAAGVTRLSLGMQSAVPSVLAVLERTHDRDAVAAAVTAARDVGLGTSLDLIYGTPGESIEQWRESLLAATAMRPDHISAYALTVEHGTRLAAQVARGAVPPPTQEDEADKYELAEALLGAQGYTWYEISNWARTPADRSVHNEGYWSGADWWGIGPGAHSHVRGVRWWNRKQPGAYVARLAAGLSPAAGREVLTAEQRHEEEVLLRVRLAEGLSLGTLGEHGRRAVAGLVAEGLLDGPAAVRDARATLTLRGRLLADTVVRRLLGW